MPDEILCRILSLVTTKEAVATRFIEALDSSMALFSQSESMTLNLTPVLSNLCTPFCSLEKPMVLISSTLSTYAFNTVILILLIILGFPILPNGSTLLLKRERRLNHLHLRLDVDHHYHLDDDSYRKFPKLPTPILTCTTLVTLDLHRFSVKGFSFSSVGFGFPSLKTLSLQRIEFNELRDFMLILAGSPILKDLRLSDIYIHTQEERNSCTIQEFKRLSFPKLTKADIYQCLYSCYMVKAVSTSVSLCIGTSTLYHNKDYKVRFITDNYMYRHRHVNM